MTDPLSKEELRKKIERALTPSPIPIGNHPADRADALMSLVWPQIEEPRELMKDALEFAVWACDVSGNMIGSQMTAIRDYLAACEKGADHD